MRPDAVFRGTIVLAIACIEHKDHIDLAILVVIVLREVDVEVGVSLHAGITNHQSRLLVVANVVVSSIVSHGLVERNRSNHIEDRAELPHRLISEIVACRTVRSRKGTTLFVHDTLEVLDVVCELYVGEFCQDDETTDLSLGGEGSHLHIAWLGNALWSAIGRSNIVQSEGCVSFEEGFFFG